MTSLKILSKQQIHVFVSLFLGYSLFSILRKPLALCWVPLREEMELSNSNYGLIISNYTLIFGFSKLIGGVLSDRIPSNILLPASLTVSTVVNLCIATLRKEYVYYLGVLWMLNGLSQGLAWPCIAKIIIDCFPVEVMGTLWSILTSAHSAGAMVAPPLLLSVLSYGWRYPFALSSLIGCIGICLFIINLRDISSLSGGVVHYTTPPIQTVVTENPRGKLEEVSYGNDNGACACKELEVGDLNGKNNSPVRRSVRIQNKTVTVIPIEQQDMSTLHYNPDSHADGGATLTHRKKTVEFATPMLFKKRGSRVGMDSNRSSVTKQIDFGDDDQTTDVEEEGTDKTESSTIEIAPQSTNQIVMQCLLYNAEVQCICVAAMFSYFGLAMFIDWFAVYLTDACLQRMEITAGLVIWIEAGALSGAFACGITSDYLNGRRSLTALLFAMLGVPVLLLFPYTQLRAISLYHTAQPLESGSGLETMLHANSEAAQHMETVPYTVEGMHHQHSSAPLFVYYGVPLSTTWIYVIARGCLLVGGFAMNGPKTLLGMSIRACTPSVISGTIGGALGLIGQGGSYLGSRLLSSLLSQKHAFLVLSVIPIGVRMGMNQIGTILFEYSVLSPYLTSLSTLLNTPVNGFDLFPLLYSTCALLAVLFLAYPAYKEYHRIIKKHPVRKVKDI